MYNIKLNGVDIKLASNLAVLYESRKLTGAKTLQEAAQQLGTLDSDGQVKLIYIAYVKGLPAGEKPMSEEDFSSLFLNEVGIFKLVDIFSSVIDGILYEGLSDSEKASKKAALEKTAE